VIRYSGIHSETLRETSSAASSSSEIRTGHISWNISGNYGVIKQLSK